MVLTRLSHYNGAINDSHYNGTDMIHITMVLTCFSHYNGADMIHITIVLT